MKKSYGIIGNPIKHSLSPVLHNYWFKKYKIDANYSLIGSNDKDLPEIINRIKEGNKNVVNLANKATSLLFEKTYIIDHILGIK